MLDRTKSDFVKQKSEEDTNEPRIGTVAAVYENLGVGGNSNFECDVLLDNVEDNEDRGFEERAVPYNGSHSRQISPPMVGDTVLVVYRAGVNNKPILMQAAYTNTDRSPLARAGMYRDVYRAWQPTELDEDDGTVSVAEDYGPAGRGDIKVTAYTQYEDNPAKVDVDEELLKPERSWYQISKEQKTPDPSDSETAPMNIEMYDSIADDEAHIQMGGNIVDNDDTKSLDTRLDFKQGTATTTATNEDTGMTTEVSQDVKNDVMSLIADDGTDEYTVDFDPSVPSITIQTSASSELGMTFNFDTGEFTILDGDGYGIESESGTGSFTWHHESIDFSEGTTTTL